MNFRMALLLLLYFFYATFCPSASHSTHTRTHTQICLVFGASERISNILNEIEDLKTKKKNKKLKKANGKKKKRVSWTKKTVFSQ